MSEALNANVLYNSHIQDIGWQGFVSSGAVSGTVGLSKRMEAIAILLQNASGGIEYSAHVQDAGWQKFVSNGQTAGTTGQSLRLEALKIRLTGAAADLYDVYYCCHVQDIGWMGWAKNGEPAGTAGYSYRAEAVKIILIEKGGSAPGPTADSYRENLNQHIYYNGYLQDSGWQGEVSDGAVSGTEGQALRLEAIKIRLENISGGIQYSAHVQNTGWQDYVADGAVSGTTEQALRLEALKVQLTGGAAELFDVYYCCHVQNIGWMGWAKNGEPAGTAGYEYRAEAVKIILIAKGGQAPGTTADCFRENVNPHVYYSSYLQDTGWQNEVSDGSLSGTTGQSKRLEAIKIRIENISGGIEYSAHVQNTGWQNFVSNGQTAGTTGQSLRLEALKIRLTGTVSDQYDVYYQCHVQNTGWMGWAKNGEPAGTAGYSYRAEAVKIMLIKKGSLSPEPATDCFRENPYPLFRYPVNFIGITAPFTSAHLGTDFGTQAGGNRNPPVYAATPGTVVDINSNNSAGNYVTVRFDDSDNNRTWYTNYKHLKSFNVSVNQIVATGTQIGIMGTTGDSTGVHLHFDLVKTPLNHIYNPATERAAYSVNPIEYVYKYPDQTVGSDTLAQYKILTA